LHALLEDEDLRRRVGRIKGLPTPPRTFQALSAAMADPDVDLDRIAAIVEGDMGLVAKVLQLVNSSFFSLARRITSVREAIAMVGTERLKSIVLTSEIYGQLEHAELPEDFDSEALSAHAQITAQIARSLIDDKLKSEFAFLAAMLHDVGLWVIAACMPEGYAHLHQECLRRGCTQDDLDGGAGIPPHSRMGAYLLGIWSLPYPVVEAVAYHRSPSRAGAASFDALGALHVANCLAEAVVAPDASGRQRAMERLDMTFLESAGVAGRIEGWLNDARRRIAAAAA